MIKNLRAFKIRFISPTNTKGARVSIYDIRREKRKIIYSDYEFDTKVTAINYLKEKCNIEIKWGFETEKEYYLLTDNFEGELK